VLESSSDDDGERVRLWWRLFRAASTAVSDMQKNVVPTVQIPHRGGCIRDQTLALVVGCRHGRTRLVGSRTTTASSRGRSSNENIPVLGRSIDNDIFVRLGKRFFSIFRERRDCDADNVILASIESVAVIATSCWLTRSTSSNTSR